MDMLFCVMRTKRDEDDQKEATGLVGVIDGECITNLERRWSVLSQIWRVTEKTSLK
jgi:hypothetical protein